MYHNARISSRGFVLRKVDGIFGACAQMFTGSSVALERPSSGSGSLRGLAGLFGIMLMFAAVVGFLLSGHHAAVSPLALMPLSGVFGITSKTGTAEKKPAKIREMEANLKSLAKELEQGQLEMTAGPIPPGRGEELEQKAKEMEDLQTHLDQYNRIAGIVNSAKQVDRVTLPTDDHGRPKSIKTSAGHLFVMSESFRQYRAQGKQGWSSKIDVKSRLGQPVMLRGDEAIEFERKAFDASTLSDLGGVDAIIPVDHDPELVRFIDPEILTIRDVLNSSTTTSDTIRYVKHTATVRNAQSQATRGAAKNYLHVTFAPTNVTVETVAVLSKVTEQDVDDAPRLVSYINGEMTLDIKVEEERQLLWGSGAGGELSGLFNEAIPEFDRSAAGDTIIDLIRKMRTDLRKKRVTPTFCTIDPTDWEQVELTKGTTAQYIWGLVTDLRGPRIWSLRVVESDAMTNLETGERRVLVGDGVRGATIYDRHDVRLAIGFVDDDFARNLRTLRAEERLALAVKRPFAFEYSVTEAGDA